MPCINCQKDELREIAMRWPEEIDRVEEWERIVSECAKRGASTLRHLSFGTEGLSLAEIYAKSGIRAAVAWSMTSRGGRQFDLERAIPSPACSSVYGLCE